MKLHIIAEDDTLTTGVSPPAAATTATSYATGVTIKKWVGSQSKHVSIQTYAL